MSKNKSRQQKPEQENPREAPQQQRPAAHDDPTSAQDDPETPEEEALRPTEADLEAKRSVEYFTPSGEFPGPKLPEEPEPTEEDATPEIISGTSADLSSEDLSMLGPRDEDMDLGEDESVRNKDLLRKSRDAESEPEPEEELDVPGAELDDEAENRGSEDEENNEYSVGGTP